METKTISSWSESLRQTLTRLQRPNASLHIAIVGVGNEIRGDDSAGVLVVRTLRYVLGPRHGLLIIDAGSAPESCTGQLRTFMPDLVLFIDSAEMGEVPGSVHWLDWHSALSGIATHGFPLSLLAQFLCDELDCLVAVIGIQPAQTDIGTPLSSSVRQAVAKIVQDATSILCEPTLLKSVM